VELNIMAAFIGCLGARVRAIYALTFAANRGQPGVTADDLPANVVEAQLASALAAAHAEYVFDDVRRGLAGADSFLALPVVFLQPG